MTVNHPPCAVAVQILSLPTISTSALRAHQKSEQRTAPRAAHAAYGLLACGAIARKVELRQSCEAVCLNFEVIRLGDRIEEGLRTHDGGNL